MKLLDIEKMKLDAAKVHNEINLLVNVRLLISLAMIPAAGFALNSWKKFNIPSNLSECLELTFTLLWVWLVMLALYFQFYSALEKVRLYAAYLRVKNFSIWEKDWYEFRFGEVNKNCDKLRKKFESVDLLGFASVFLVSFFILVSQIIYIIIVSVYSIVIKPKLCVLDFGNLAVPFAYSLMPILPLLLVCYLWWIIYKKAKNAISEQYENKLVYMWCSVLNGNGYVKCGDEYYCEHCNDK